ncbi:DUF4097 family beta strand repeat-containing protein [Alkalicoccus halolimnae]|uniref:DUF4097 domain-containing protein n=1 Tax=Alkalicoccus halolimnae TaxID=1667239 RepID=A0A5C7F2L0_9BACI|nr:DUF4097 domain-containing protein [Alkalicoccus halolimnae]TXF84336.1 DUF4097 domain-containing protein [Alkalicoccus halolimnae]
MQEERQMILKMIEDGKISAEEGMRLLNALKEGSREEEEPASSKEKNQEGKSQGQDQRSQWDYRKAEETFNTFATKFSEFVDDAVHRVKEFDLDFNFGPSESIQHVFEHKDVFLKEADIHIENGNIELKPWNEKDIRIECDVQVYRMKDKESAKREFLRDVQFSFSNGKLKLEARKKTMRVNTVIYFPTEHLDKLKLYTFNGKMNGEDIPVHRLEAKAINGKVSFDRVDAKEVRIETINGPINIRRLHSMEAELKTMNGTLNIEAGRGNMHLESVNGTIHFRLSEASQSKAYIKTTTGSIYIAVPDGVKTEGEAKTNVGGIHCQLPNMSVIDEKKDFANKKLTFLANKEGEGHFYIEAEASTGSVNIK